MSTASSDEKVHQNYIYIFNSNYGIFIQIFKSIVLCGFCRHVFFIALTNLLLLLHPPLYLSLLITMPIFSCLLLITYIPFFFFALCLSSVFEVQSILGQQGVEILYEQEGKGICS